MLSLFVKRKRSYERRLALTVALTFVVTGLAWVFLTDVLIYGLVENPTLIARFETAKGWIFVAMAGTLVYVVTLRGAVRMTRARAVISAVVDSIADGVLLLGPDRKIRHANPAASRMLLCDDLVGLGAEEFSRRFRVSYPDGSVVPPDQLLSQRAFSEGGPLHHKALLFRPGAAELVISATAAAVRDEVDESPGLVVSVLHDITASEHLARMRDEFLAAAAHALKTPVTIIKTNVQTITAGDLVQLPETIAAIERQCSRIDRIVQNLLVLARTRSRTLQLRHDDVDLAPLVERIAQEMAAAVWQRSVRSDVKGSPRVRADEDRLGLSLRNLIDRGCRSAVPGSSVTLQLRHRGDDAEIGVSYQALAAEETTIESGGAYDEVGIGRLVVESIVAAHGWTLRDETAGSAVTTWVRMPLLVPQADGP